MLRVVHYLNQFFGQVGGEEKANLAPLIREGPLGPGHVLQELLGEQGQVMATLVCGDNYAVEQPERALEELLALTRPWEPDLVLAGPAFNAGRYGQACGALCAAIQDRLGVPALTAMHPENPGVELFRRQVYILRCGESARDLRPALERMVRLALKLRSAEPLGPPHEEGYYPRGLVRQELVQESAAQRVVAMLLAKLRGEPYRSEVPLPEFPRVMAPPPLADLRHARIALVTDGGLVPRGNPDGIEARAATKFGTYSIAGVDDLKGEDYEVSHGGYDTSFAQADPDRLVPVDALRELEREGRIGALHDAFFSTSGMVNPLENSRRLGRELAQELRRLQIDAVILTST